jgi:hypothetical protein
MNSKNRSIFLPRQEGNSTVPTHGGPSRRIIGSDGKDQPHATPRVLGEEYQETPTTTRTTAAAAAAAAANGGIVEPPPTTATRTTTKDDDDSFIAPVVFRGAEHCRPVWKHDANRIAGKCRAA